MFFRENCHVLLPEAVYEYSEFGRIRGKYPKKLSLNFFHDEGFKHIPLTDIIKLLDTNTTLVALKNFLYVVLEAAERGDLILEDNYTVTNDTDGGLT